MNYFSQNQQFKMPFQNMNMPANANMNIPLGMPPCMMMPGQYNNMPGVPANQMPQTDHMDMEDIAAGMIPTDLPMNHYNWPALNNTFPMDSSIMPLQMNNVPLMGNMMNNIHNNMPMFNVHEASTSPSVAVKSKDLQEALGLIKEAVSGEAEDRLFYEYLLSVAPNDEEKSLIKGIKDDEIKHFGYFRKLYKDLTGSNLPAISDGEFKKPKSYCDGIKDALLGEQRAVEKYRKILSVLTDRTHFNMLVEIITDELRHGIIYNYLYSKNKCGK